MIPTRKPKYSEKILTQCHWVHHKLLILKMAKIIRPSLKFLLSNIYKFGSRVNVPQNVINMKMFLVAKIVYFGHQSKSFKFKPYPELLATYQVTDETHKHNFL
jgi:hypothetical protein